jgi:hypothetical protein
MPICVRLTTYDVFLAPPPGGRLVASKLNGVVVDADSTWDTVVLESGVIVGVNVQDAIGRAVEGVDIDFTFDATGEEVFTPNDDTDALGEARIVVPADRYTVELIPPAGSGLMRTAISNVEIQNDTTMTVTLDRSGEATPPSAVALLPNKPNPFNGTTVIPYVLTQPANVSVRVFNVRGQMVKVLQHGFHLADQFETVWDGTNAAGHTVAGGVYFVELRTSLGTQTRKLLLVR